jgi:transcription initiation factor TFIIIB Brf1 subunit/transcription initiation factor TFIIB
MNTYFFSDTCSHLYPVRDVHEGTLVCPDCAKVLDACMLLETRDIPPPVNPIHIKLQNICANGNIPKSVEGYANWFFYLICQEFADVKQLKREDEILAFSLYESLARFNVPRTPEEIHRITGVLPSALWTIESKMKQQTTTHINPVLYVERYATFLELTYIDIKKIQSIIGNMYGMGDVRPRCLVATVIHLYCKELKLRIPLKRIVEVCNVSCTTVHKLMKKMDLKYVTNISLLASK